MAKGKKSRSKLGQKKTTKSTTRRTRKGVAQNKSAKSKKVARRLPDTATDASDRL